MPEPPPLPGAPAVPASTVARPPVDIPSLNEFLVSVGSFAEDWIFGVGPDKSLYHYTDFAGLLGILSTNDLWLTHSRFSNDEQELTHGYDIARRLIREARDQPVAPLPEWPVYLDRLSALLEQPPAQGVYICCFCKANNLLSQWRGYAGNGNGVSIRMQPSRFDMVTGPDSPHNGLMRLWKTFYDQTTQEEILRLAIRSPFSAPGDIDHRAARAADAIEFFIPTFKNADFREEDECRLIFSPPEHCPVQPAFRVRGSVLVPYYSLKELCGGRPLPVTGVTIGPSTNRVMNVESVRMMLAKFGYAGVTVDASPTPYRA
jgi:hypothetical protein